MNGSATILSLLEQWRQLTEREGEAILREDLSGVTEQQKRKELLTQEMTPAGERLNLAQMNGQGAGQHDEVFRTLLAQVVALEARNGEALSAKRQLRKAELERLNQAAHNLHSVRRAYGTSSQ